MNNNPDAALVDSFFLPGGILDPESYEKDERSQEKKPSLVETNIIRSPLPAYKGYSPTNMDPNNPWASTPLANTPPAPPPMVQTPAIALPQRESLLFSTSRSPSLLAPDRFSTVKTNTSNLYLEDDIALQSNPNLQKKIAMAPPPGFESSIPQPSPVHSIFPTIRNNDTFEEDDSIACSVPRELISSHQEKNSIYGDGSSTSSLSHSTCGGTGRHDTSEQEINEDEMILQECDEQHATNPTQSKGNGEKQRNLSQQDDKIEVYNEEKERKRKHKEPLQQIDDVICTSSNVEVTKVQNRKESQKCSDVNIILRKSEKCISAVVKPEPLANDRMKVQTNVNSPPTSIETDFLPLIENRHSETKSKRRRGNQRSSPSLDRPKNQHHGSLHTSLLTNEKDRDRKQRKRYHNKTPGKNNAGNQQKASKTKPDLHFVPKNISSIFLWGHTVRSQQTHNRKRNTAKWSQISSLTQRKQKVARVFLLVISLTSAVLHAALKEIFTNVFSISVYLFFWVFPYISTELFIQILCLPHWVSHLTTLSVVWEITAPATKSWKNQWFRRLIRGKRVGKSKLEFMSKKNIDGLHSQEQKHVLILYTFRLLALSMFLYDGFSQSQSSILLYLAPSSRTLLAYILLIIRRGWYRSPLLLLWIPLVQCSMRLFLFSSPLAVIFNVIIGLAALQYQNIRMEDITHNDGKTE